MSILRIKKNYKMTRTLGKNCAMSPYSFSHQIAAGGVTGSTIIGRAALRRFIGNRLNGDFGASS